MGVLVLLALTPPASAATVAYRTPAMGPVLAGSDVVWGEEARDGSIRVVRGAPREVAWSLAPTTAPRSERGFMHTPWALAASEHGWAALPYVGTVTSESFDSVSTSIDIAAVSAHWGEPPAVVSGEIADRGDRQCAPGSWSAGAVAVDGDRVAVAETACATFEQRVVVDGTAVPVGDVPRALALAGRWLAWTTGVGAGDSLTICDLSTGQRALRLTRGDLGRWIEDIDLAEDGRVLFTMAGPGDFGSLLAIAQPGVPEVRHLLRRVAPRGIALAGDGVLYTRYKDRHYRRSVLKLESIEGGIVRKLATFRRGRRQVGDVDLSESRAVWAVRGARVTHGRRIVLRRL